MRSSGRLVSIFGVFMFAGLMWHSLSSVKSTSDINNNRTEFSPRYPLAYHSFQEGTIIRGPGMDSSMHLERSTYSARLYTAHIVLILAKIRSRISDLYVDLRVLSLRVIIWAAAHKNAKFIILLGLSCFPLLFFIYLSRPMVSAAGRVLQSPAWR